MKKKIAILNSVYNQGSTGRICFELSNYFETFGFSSKVFYGRNKNKTNNGVYFGSNASVYFHAAMSRLTDKHGLFSRKATKELLNKIDEYNPDIFVLNNLHGYYINYEILLKYLIKQNKPVVWIFHDCWNFTGHCAYFSFNKCEKWKTECRKCKYLHTYPASIFFDHSNSNYLLKKKLFEQLHNLYIVSPSHWMNDLVGDSFLKDKSRCVINNGIDLNVFSKKEKCVFRKKYGLDNKKLLLCVAYKFDKRKGIDDIAKAIDAVDGQTKIVLVGDSSKIKSHSTKIIRIRKTDNLDELVDIYSSCDALFNPTYEDNYPTVNMEAAACDLPVICYKTGGAIESVDKKFIVEQGDVKTAIDLFDKICAGKIHYDFKIKESFSKDIMFEKYKDLINRLILDK